MYVQDILKKKQTLVDSLSRLSRDVNSNVIIVGKLTKLNARIISADMEIPDGITGKFFRNLITVMRQYEAQSNQLRVFIECMLKWRMVDMFLSHHLGITDMKINS